MLPTSVNHLFKDAEVEMILHLITTSVVSEVPSTDGHKLGKRRLQIARSE